MEITSRVVHGNMMSSCITMRTCTHSHMCAHACTTHTYAHPYIHRHIYTYNSVVIIILRICKDIHMCSHTPRQRPITDTTYTDTSHVYVTHKCRSTDTHTNTYAQTSHHVYTEYPHRCVYILLFTALQRDYARPALYQ